MKPIRAIILLLATATALAASPALAQKNVSLELLTEPGFSVTGQQRWLAALKDLEVGSLRIRQGQDGDRAEIQEAGAKNARSFTVVGLITNQGKLVVPGAAFTLAQKAELKAYLAKIGSGKANEPEEKIVAFGLSPEQLVATHEALAGKISFSTKNKPVGDVARQIVKGITLQVTVDADAKKAVAEGEIILDELQGLSQGTALAAALRPAGLVFAPVRVGNEVQLRVADSRALAESWPIGWPSQKGLSETLPKLGNFLNANITDVPLANVLDSVQGRVEAPFLIDHNGLALARIDPAAIKVSVPPGKTFYKRILDVALSKARLACELRLDEADTPFVWISVAGKPL